MTENKNRRPVVESYSDATAFLRDYYAYKKAIKGYTYRQMSRETGIALGYLNMLMNGKRALDVSHVPAIAKAFELRPQEQSFLENLVLLAQTAEPEQKQAIIRRMSRRSGFRERFQLDVDYLEYLSHWYLGALLELIDSPAFDPNPDSLALQLRPSVTASEIKDGLETLLRLGLVEIDNGGRWRRTTKLLQTPDEGLNREIVAAYHAERLNVAHWALAHLDPSERNFGAITAKIDDATWRDLQQFMHEQRKAVVEFLRSRDSGGGDVVIHINWQTFPVTFSLSSSRDDEDK